jgi:HEAT repeat protein
VRYPSVPDADATPGLHDEPPVQVREDRVPSSRLGEGPPHSTADLRLAIEQLLRRKEAFDPKPWESLGERARPLMIAMLADDALLTQPALRHRLIAALAELHETRAVAPLGELLRRESTPAATKAFAANALGRIGDPSAVEALVALLADKDDMIRRQLAMALGRIGTANALPHLLVLARDDSVAVNEVAIEAVRGWERKSGHKLVSGIEGNRRKKTPKRKVMPAPDRG